MTRPLGWQPQALVTLDAEGLPLETLARPVSAPANEAASGAATPAVILSADGQTLTYAAHWTDPTLSETFVSRPGSLEQSLVLSKPPVSSDAGRWSWLPAALRHICRLPNQAGWPLKPTFSLLSGESLWANGRLQTEQFSTAGSQDQTIEIRNKAGETVIALAPVIAYEHDNPPKRAAAIT